MRRSLAIAAAFVLAACAGAAHFFFPARDAIKIPHARHT